jgi:hypothetical protein
MVLNGSLKEAIAAATAPLDTASDALSVSICANDAARLAPSATRAENSGDLRDARAQKRSAIFVQAIRSSSPEALSSKSESRVLGFS